MIWLISAWKMYIVRRSGSESWQENYKTLEDRKSCECYVSRKFKKPILKLSFFLSFFSLFFSVFIIFHSHFWLSLGQQSGGENISIRRQTSMNLQLYHHGEIKIRCHIEFSEKLFNLELPDRSFHKMTFASFRYLYSHKT